MISQIQFLNKIKENSNFQIFQSFFCIIIIILSHVSIEYREVSDEFYKIEEFIQINCCNLLIVSRLIQKLYVYLNLLFIASKLNIFGVNDYLWVLFLLILIDLYLQIKLFIKYIVAPQFYGPEYFELHEIEDSYDLTENKHKFQNLRFIKAKNQNAISLKLILSSYSNNEIIRVGYYSNSYRQFIDSTLYQQVLFLDKIDIDEFEETIQANSINSNILKIVFEYQLSFQELIQFSKILINNNAFLYIISSYRVCGRASSSYLNLFHKLQHNFIITQRQKVVSRIILYNKYYKEYIPLNPPMVLYDLFD
ncbi:hypothetical protein ABPG74_012676 [Tetrahymena malaccensis]